MCARREAGVRRPAPSTSADSPCRPEPRRGRSRARLFLLPALALLLGALSLFHAAPAAAQTLAAPPNLQVTAHLGRQGLLVTWGAPSYTVDDASARWRVKDTDPNTVGNQPGSWLPAATGEGAPYNQWSKRRIRVPGRCRDPSPIFGGGTNPPTCDWLTIGVTYEVQIQLAATASQTTGWLSAGDGTPVALPPPTGLTVTPKDTALDLTWTEPSTMLRHGYDVHYTSSTAVANGAAASGSDASTAWVDTGYFANLLTRVRRYTITGLTNGTAYRVRVRTHDDGGGDPSTWVFGTGTPALAVSLSAAPNPVAEGSSVTVTATLSTAAEEDVTIPVTVTLDTAEEADLDAANLALLRAGLTFTAGTTTSSGTLATEQDADGIDETFTVALGALPSGVAAGSVTSVAITIQDDEFTGSRVTLWAPDKVDEGRPVTVRATLDEAASSDVEIRFTGTLGTGDPDTAAELEDFDAASQALFGAGLTATIPAGEWTVAIELGTVHDNGDDGDDETFTVSIDAASLPSGYGAGAKISHTVTIDDDERLNPDPNLLTGLTLDDGERELFFMTNRFGDAVGLGGPDNIYTVQVSPGRRWIEVTPVWTNPAITSVTGRVRYYDSRRSDGGTLTWSSSGATERLDMQSPLGGPGHPLLTLTVNGATGQPYRIFFQHNFDWENANDALERLYLRFRSSP